MNVLNKCDARWVALLLDTEGTITVNKTGPHAHVSCGMTSVPVLEELARLVGEGSVRKRTTAKGHYRQMYLWQLASQQAATLLRQVQPYLLEKRRQAILCIALADRMSSAERYGRGVPDEERAHRTSMAAAVRQLNRGEEIGPATIASLCQPFRRKTCANGHPWRKPHRITTPTGKGVCRTCRNEQARGYSAKRRERR